MMPINITKFFAKLSKFEQIKSDIEDDLLSIKEEIPVYEPGKKTKRKFFSSMKKAQEAKLIRINLSIRELEGEYNRRYNHYATWRDKCHELEYDFNKTENEITSIISQSNDIRNLLMMQAATKEPPTLEHLMRISTLAELNTKLMKLETKKASLKRQLIHYENRNVQVLKPLYELKELIIQDRLKSPVIPKALHIIRDAAIAHIEGKTVTSEPTKSPLDIIKQKPEYTWQDGMRPAANPTRKPDPNDFAFDIKVKGENNDEKKKA